VLVQPFGERNVTEYTPEVNTVILGVVAPVLQMIFTGGELVSVTDPPLQNVVGPPGVITGGGGDGYTLIVKDAVSEQNGAALSVTVTENTYTPGVPEQNDVEFDVVASDHR
jgi:hypothetical protein